ncbi:MAG: hypothetical protein JXA95_02425 [Spirochaetales bacterium]|nr:hypothetical protein [Spirochaetales bacterium]
MKKSVVTMYSFLVIVALVLLAGWLGYTYYTDSTGSLTAFQEEVPQLNKTISDMLLETENPGSSRFQQSMEDFLKGKPQIKGVLIYSGEDKLYYTRLESRNNRLMENLQKNEQFLLNKLNDGSYRAPFGIAHDESPLISLKGTPLSISYLHETFSPVKVYNLLLKALYIISGLFLLTLILLIASSVKEKSKGVEKNDDFFEPPVPEPSQVSVPSDEEEGDSFSPDLSADSFDDLDDMDFDTGESAPSDLSDMDFGLPEDTADLGDLSVLDDIDLSDDDMMLPGGDDDDFAMGGDSGLDSLDDFEMSDSGDDDLNLDLDEADVPDEVDVLDDMDLGGEMDSLDDLELPDESDDLDDLELPEETGSLDDLELDDDMGSLNDPGDLEFPEENDSLDDLNLDEEMDSLDDLVLPESEDDSLEDFDLDEETDSLELPDETDELEDFDLDEESDSLENLDDLDLPEESDSLEDFDLDESLDDGGDLFGDLTDEEEEEDPQMYSPRSHVCWESFLNDRLPQELDRASSENEDLSFVYLRDNSVQNDDDYRDFSESLTKDFPYRDMIFEWGDQGFAMILPNSDLVETLEKLDVFINNLPERDIRIGVTSRNGRLLDKDQLIGEASAAIKRTSHDNKIVGFRADPERYRESLSES